MSDTAVAPPAASAMPPWMGMLGSVGLLGVAGYLYAAMMKGNKMTALENAMLNFVGPLIDTLRAVERDRDTWKERYGKVQDQYAELSKKSDAFEKDNEELRKAATVAETRILELRDALDRVQPRARKVKVR